MVWGSGTGPIAIGLNFHAKPWQLRVQSSRGELIRTKTAKTVFGNKTKTLKGVTEL